MGKYLVYNDVLSIPVDTERDICVFDIMLAGYLMILGNTPTFVTNKDRGIFKIKLYFFENTQEVKADIIFIEQKLRGK